MSQRWRHVATTSVGDVAVCVSRFEGEYRVRTYRGAVGAYREEEDYFTSDKQDALGTAKHILSTETRKEVVCA